MEEWVRIIPNLTSEKSLFSQCRKDLLNVLGKNEEYNEELHSQIEGILRGYKNRLGEILSMNDKEDSPNNIFDTVSDLLKKIKDVDEQKLKSFYRNIIKIVVDKGCYGYDIMDGCDESKQEGIDEENLTLKKEFDKKGKVLKIGNFENTKIGKIAIIKVGDNYGLINDNGVLVIPAIYKSMRKISDDAYYYQVTKKSLFGEIEGIIGLGGEKYFGGTGKRIASMLNSYPL